MLGFRNRQKTDPRPPESELEAENRPGLFRRLKDRLSRTRNQLSEGVANLVLGRKAIDDDLLEELETLLLTADVGVEATQRIIGTITEKVKRKELADAAALITVLKAELLGILQSCERPTVEPDPGCPRVILMVGVNGVGKTTTIGKLAKRFQTSGHSVMLAAPSGQPP